MAAIKSYTDLEQSKKLSKILPIDTADNYYSWHDERYYVVNKDCPYPYSLKEKIPCWSLAALVSVLPKGTNISTPDPLNKIRYSCWNDYDIAYASNPVDACVEMIVKLKEKDLL